MLKITVEHEAKTAILKLAGKLAGPWVEELDRTWHEVSDSTAGGTVLLDLCDVTFVAPEGRMQLTRMCEQGATFKTSGCFGKGLVDEIVRNCSQDRPGAIGRA
jgi:hypothetical protein